MSRILVIGGRGDSVNAPPNAAIAQITAGLERGGGEQAVLRWSPPG
ncbi:hypothetical protein DB30_03889 [Enhygromyxa salina]|uniref:Uncharacterized protein n=1 Tax=Enhygromyxa salina TaxID=215803 RepID=A0A0C2A798_9BACT|nr:hypothetical protein [Enhygromyxa salina]KIG19333.1 hypothetical protein DB30_03889 [Enhygromyxa salina]